MRFRPSSWKRWQLGPVVAVALLLCVGLAACNESEDAEGPGPVGTVGPVGQVGGVDEGEDSGEPGSGNIVTEIREVAGFDQIVFQSEGDVTVAVGTSESLMVEVDDNLQQYIEASITEGTLTIVAATDIAPTETPIFTIGVSTLTGIDLAGAGSISVDTVGSERLSVVLTGAGDVNVDSLEVGELSVRLDGVGTITLAGTADRQEVTVAGVGSYEGSAVATRSAIVEARGGAAAVVWVSEELDAVAVDAGAISYYGSPVVTEEVSGGGSVTALGAK
jgi:hypothetical protein